MKYAVLGTGSVGRTLGRKLVELGHEVVMGSRSAENAEGVKWAAETGGRIATFADAAAFGEVILNATSGMGTLAALEAGGDQTVDGKILIDVSNPLDFSKGMPPTLSVCNDDSLGEQVQRRFPKARVVKTLNTVSALLMTAPGLAPRPHTVFIAGEDDSAKEHVRALLVSLGWEDAEILDLGGIETARGTEMYMALWLRLAARLGNWTTTVRVVHGT